jgi:hypothetical protein
VPTGSRGEWMLPRVHAALCASLNKCMLPYVLYFSCCSIY